MRIAASLLPLRNIEPSDLNLRNPWKSASTQRRHSNDNIGIQYLKIPRGRSRGKQNLPAAGRIGAVTCLEGEKKVIIMRPGGDRKVHT